MKLGMSNPTRRYSYQQELKPRAKFFYGWLGGHCPQLKFSKLLELSETNPAMQLMFGLHVNIDKGNSYRPQTH